MATSDELRVIPAVDITPTNMISSNVPEADYPIWVNTTNYTVIGTRVMWKHRIYESLANVPAGVEPGNETITTTNPAKWLDLGPTNKWKMVVKQIDGAWQIGTATTNPETIDFTVRTGKRINSIGLVGVGGVSVKVQVIVSGSVVYESTQAMSLKAGGSWYQYYFGQFKTRRNAAFLDLPPFSNADIRVLISAPGATAKLGMVVMGMSKNIGYAMYDTSLPVTNYSTVKEDATGSVSITPRGSRDAIDFNVSTTADRISSIRATLADVNGKAALYVGNPSLDYTVIIGYYERLEMNLPSFNQTDYRLPVRSLM